VVRGGAYIDLPRFTLAMQRMQIIALSRPLIHINPPFVTL
jgi:hypothetical protein